MTRTIRQGRQSGNGRAVSPVIGVILMVAVTVVLAAAIGTFVLNLGGIAATTPPMASVSVTADPVSDTLTVYHRGGDRLDASRTRVVLRNESADEITIWQPTAERAILAVGGSATVNVSGETIEWNGEGDDDYLAVAGDVDGVAPRTAYTLQFVDVPSGRMIAETRVIA